MPPTYKPNDAVIFAREFVKGIPVTAIDSTVCDIVQSTIWDYYPWNFTIKQSLKAGGAFLADKVQDIAGVPTDFYRLLWARLRRTDLTDGNYYQELTPVQRLDPVSAGMVYSYHSHRFIAYHPDLAKFRLEYQLSINTGTELTQLDIDYQKSPTTITDTTMAVAFADQPDWFFPLFADGVMWRFMVLANDKRQGALQVMKNGSKVYAGQMGVFYNGLMERMVTERQMYGAFRYPAEGSIGSR